MPWFDVGHSYSPVLDGPPHAPTRLPCGVEFQHRRGRVAALADALPVPRGRERQLGAVEGAGIVAAVDHPDVIAIVDAEPIVCPSTQLLGIGLGQNGSTSKRGACLAWATASWQISTGQRRAPS